MESFSGQRDIPNELAHQHLEVRPVSRLPFLRFVEYLVYSVLGRFLLHE